jgi:hypothetical protein
MSNLSRQFLFVISTGTTSTSVSIPINAFPFSGPFSSNVFYSLPEKGDGYFGSGDGIHTVTYTVDQGFDGSITMQGSLATSPVDQDWFDIANTTVTYSPFPVAPVSTYTNFTGNFVWVRAAVTKPNVGLGGGLLVINYNR